MWDQDGQYLTSLESALQQASRDFQPDLILYNAGTDILEGDPLGRSASTYALLVIAVALCDCDTVLGKC